MSLGDDSKRLADLIDSVADGRSVDWNAAGTSPTDARMRRLHEMLRIVDGIAEVHRSEPVSPEAETRSRVGTDDPTRGTAASIPTDGALGQWGHFLLVQKLGEGAFGEVYHARDTWLDHSVALKLLKRPLVDRKRFLHEARTLAQIRHPNVVAIHGADEHAGRLGFWMDFVDGHTLAEVVAREGVRSPAEAAVIGQDLCRAMAAVHATGIVHRDLKAQNVMRQAQTGHIILMDFGAGEAMDADRAGRRPTGTPLYLAPELFDGSIATRETDIYALGVLLFNLVTRSYPVHGESMGDLLRAHRRHQRHHLGDMRPDLPDAFVQVVEKMLAPDPALRYHSATEARKALEEVVVPRPMETGANTRLVISTRQRIYTWTTGTALAVISLAVIGMVSTVVYESTFGVSPDFNADSYFRSTVGYGAQALVAPAIRLTLYAIGAMLVAAVARVVCRLIPAAGQAASRGAAICRAFLEHHELSDPALALQVTAGLGALALGVLAFAQWSNVTIFAIDVGTAPPDRLAALQPANEPHYDVLQRLEELLLFAYGLAVYNVYLLVKETGGRIPRSTVAYLIAVPALTVLLMRAMPYRVVYANAFRRVDYGETRCYQVGDKPGWVRLFCPDEIPPRIRDHKENDPLLHDRNITERVFTPRDQAAVFDTKSP